MSTIIAGPAAIAMPDIPTIAGRNSVNLARSASNRTMGNRVYCHVAKTLTGVRYRHVASGTETATAYAWNSSGTLLGSASLSVSASQIYTFVLGSYAIDADDYVTIGVSIPGVHVRWTTNEPVSIAAPLCGGNVLQDNTWEHNNAGTLPNTRSAGTPPTKYAVGPVFA